MYSFRKSKKGFTLVELMVVVAIIGILALLGLRLFLMQQIRAKNAIVKANSATCHTIIQGNLADTDYSDTTIWTTIVSDQAAVSDIRDMLGVLLDNVPGSGQNVERPAGMKNPHLTGNTDLVVHAINTKYPTSAEFKTAADALELATVTPLVYAGAVIVGEDTNITNKFYIVGLDNDSVPLGEVYVAMK